MKAVKWNPEVLIADRGNPMAGLADWVDEAGQGERLRVEIRPSASRWDLQRGCMLGSQALFREGCIKVAEANLQLHPHATTREGAQASSSSMSTRSSATRRPASGFQVRVVRAVACSM